MNSDNTPEDSGRRSFLSGAAAAGVGTAVAVVVPAGSALADSRQPQADASDSKGYQLSQHVLDYYKTAAS